MSLSNLPGGRRWLVIAATSVAEAERFAADREVWPELVVSKAELVAAGRHLRTLAREKAVDAAAVHSASWDRQPNPQLYEFALALLEVDERWIFDGASKAVFRVERRSYASLAAELPLNVGTGLAGTAREALRLMRPTRVRRRHRPPPRPSRERAVVAIWPGSGGVEVGGAITHISGILGGFRRAGFRVGLLTVDQPPKQLASVIDDLELIPPLSRGARITRDVEAICSNEALRHAGVRLVGRLPPAFLYQRHSPFLVAGLDLARACCAPLVLEWNGSLIWTRAHWQDTTRVARLFNPLLAAMERHTLREASLIVAISRRAADMTHEPGVDRNKVTVVPNGVNADRVRAVTASGVSASTTPLVGWIGSFGLWHGAEVLVRALPKLPLDVRLLMIGEGVERERCRAIADALGVSARIEWAGALPHEQALRRLAGCTLLASPHVPHPDYAFFGSPTKIFEFMALARPLVASRLEQLAEVLEDGKTARLVKPGDPDELAAAISEVLAAPASAERMAQAARQEAEERHTWYKRADAILERLALLPPVSAS